MIPGLASPARLASSPQSSATFRLHAPHLRPQEISHSDHMAPSLDEDMVCAAVSYRELHDRVPCPDMTDLEAWCSHFPGPRHHAQLFRDLHEADPRAARRLADALTRLPEAGDEFASFHLIAELGRGAFGRVFLARQGELADRPVVLKVATHVWSEAQMLARLQHTNIVPVYSVHRTASFQAVCMPFLGSTTLEDVLTELHRQPTIPETAGFLFTLLQTQAATSREPEAQPEARGEKEDRSFLVSRPSPLASLEQEMGRLGYVEAVLWLAARLTDGLAHAHDHGIIHCDLKPANVLLSDDGQPMLLDFNVADDSRLRTSAAAMWVGGTLPYMSPEHLAAFTPPTNQLVRPRVDARSDLYSLGIILYELLTRRYPFEVYEAAAPEVMEQARAARMQPPPRMRPYNPAVSPAVEAIVRHCLEPDPARRYQSARELQEDLERHQADRPLRHAPNPSLREQVGKWSRRNRRPLTSAALAAAAAVVVVLGLALMVRTWRLAEVERREAALAECRAFQEEARTIRFLLYTRATEPDQRAAGINLARQALGRFHVLANPSWADGPLVRDLPPTEQDQLRQTLGEVLLLLSRALAMADPEADEEQRSQCLAEALELLRAAQACDPAQAGCPAWWRQQAELVMLLGQAEEAQQMREKAASLPLETARDRYWLASEHFSRGRPGDALPLLREAVHREPDNFWAWFVLGNCYDRLGQDARAEACYGTCVALMPDFPWAHFNRGLALLRQHEHEQALLHFDEALRLKPHLTEALVNRALARQGLGHYSEAIADLTRALDLGAPETRLYFLRARLREKVKDVDGARRDYEEGLRREPADEKSWIARGLARLNREPQAALADFTQALKINPRSVAALQNSAHVLAEKLNQPEAALAMMEKAVACAPESGSARSGRGVLLARLGRRDAACRDAEDALLRDASPARRYQVACIYALTSVQEADDRPRALQLLAAAVRQGYGLDLLERDHDLDPLRTLPEFHRLVEAARALRANPAP